MSIAFHSFVFFSTVFAIEKSLKVITFVIRIFSLCTPNLKKITDYVLNQNKDFGAQKWSVFFFSEFYERLNNRNILYMFATDVLKLE